MSGTTNANHSPIRAHQRIHNAGHCEHQAMPAPADGANGVTIVAMSADHSASGTAGVAKRFDGNEAKIAARPKCHHEIGAVARVAAPVTRSAVATTYGSEVASEIRRA